MEVGMEKWTGAEADLYIELGGSSYVRCVVMHSRVGTAL